MPISAAGGKQAPSTVLVPVAVDGDVGGTLRAQATSLADWHGRPPRIIAGTQHILGPPGLLEHPRPPSECQRLPHGPWTVAGR